MNRICDDKQSEIIFEHQNRVVEDDMPQQDESFSLPSVDSDYQLVTSMPTGDEIKTGTLSTSWEPPSLAKQHPQIPQLLISPKLLLRLYQASWTSIVANSTSSNNFLFRPECRCDQQPSGVQPGHHRSIPQSQNGLRSFHDDEQYHVQSTDSN
jgi:hypothetical protein